MRATFIALRSLPLAFALVCALPAAAAELTAEMTPEAVAAETFARMRAEQWREAAEAFDPAALKRFRGIFGSLEEGSFGQTMAAALFPQKTASDLAKIDDVEFFAGFIGSMMGAMGGVVEIGEQRVLGAVPEGADRVHLVVRSRSSALGIQTTRMQVVSLNRTARGWRMDLSGEMEGLAEGYTLARELGDPAKTDAAADDAEGDR